MADPITRLFPGEQDAVDAVLEAGRYYGYGNLIAHLKRAWARMLMRDHGLSEAEALRMADTSAYPLDPPADLE
jgi:hypothetical protein